MKRLQRLVALGAGLTLAGGLGATTSAASLAPQSADNDPISIEVVTHGQASDPFWSVFKRGLDDAAAQYGANVNYAAPATWDMTEMASLIDAAVAKQPDGLVVSVPDYRALQDSYAAAAAAGIPIITVNSGSDVYQEIGAITHIGQDEFIAGQAAGARLAEAGATHVLCVIHGSATPASMPAATVPRSRSKAGGTSRRAGRPQRRCRRARHDQRHAAGQQHIDAVLALGPTATSPALDAIAELGSDVMVAGFDVSQDVIEAIIAGDMLFTVDQQQYLQGYLPVVILALYHDNLNTVGGGQPVLTGPGFIDASNAEAILALAGEGSR